MRVLVIDARIAGVAGDMFLAALIDLLGKTEPLYRVVEAVEVSLNLHGELKVEVSETSRGGLRAKLVKVDVEPRHYSLKASEALETTRKVCREAGASEQASRYALKVMEDLAEAEQRVHGTEGDVELHQLSSPDTFIDVVGSAILLDEAGFLGQVEVYATPPVLGGGVIKLPHAELRGPAPATLEILRKHRYPFVQTSIDEELTTPTGIAILTNLAEKVVDLYPPMKVERVGYGAGVKELGGIPNVLRMVEGSAHAISMDRVMVLETGLDDVTGEVVGYLAEKLMKTGALDVYVIPALGKKGRPSFQVKVLAKPEGYLDLVETLMNETGTLGVRVREEPRVIAEREEVELRVEVGGEQQKVKVKVSRDPSGRLLNVKPEFEDLKRIAIEQRRPLREVLEEVKLKTLEKMMKSEVLGSE